MLACENFPSSLKDSHTTVLHRELSVVLSSQGFVSFKNEGKEEKRKMKELVATTTTKSMPKKDQKKRYFFLGGGGNL